MHGSVISLITNTVLTPSFNIMIPFCMTWISKPHDLFSVFKKEKPTQISSKTSIGRVC